jgi:membrane-bound serine protease (ClpP class)
MPGNAAMNSRMLGLLAGACALLGTMASPFSIPAQESRGADDADLPARLVLIDASLDAATLEQVRVTASDLKDLAVHEGRRPLLVLEIRPGGATLADAASLAEFLASSDLDGVRTVAWVPDTLTGPRALPALLCREIVLHPDAELGALSEGNALSPAERDRILRLAGRRINPQVTPALVAAMLDPQATLLRVTVAGLEGRPETRLITPDELGLLRQAGIEVRDLETLKAPDSTGVFSGAAAEAGGFLIAHTATSTTDVARQYGVDPETLSEGPPAVAALRPTLIKLDGMIEPIQTEYLTRQIDRAVAGGSTLLIFEIDSPGGYLEDSLELAFQIADLEQRGVRTVAYVPREAISGAAIIALGCDEIYLHPQGKIGDAGPIMAGPDGVIHRAPEKIVSYLRGHLKELAELKGRPPALLMAMADRELTVYRATHRDSGRVAYLSQAEIDGSEGVWEKGRVVPESEGELLLTVDGRRAHELRIAQSPVADFAELKQRLGVGDDVRIAQAQRTWLDDTVFILNSPVVTGLLFFLGIILVFVEMHFMVGIFGIAAALCFSVFFWSKFLGGTSDWLEVVLFLVGLVCVAMELFVIPGFGVFGVAGGMLILASLVMASVSYNSVDENVTYAQAWQAVKSLSVAIVAVIGAGALLSQFLPRIPLLNAMILTPPNLGAPPMRSGTGGAESRGDASGLTGRRGEALTMLRPSGKVRIDGRLIDAVSTGGYIEQGSAIEVVGVSGGRTVVKAVDAWERPEAAV